MDNKEIFLVSLNGYDDSYLLVAGQFSLDTVKRAIEIQVLVKGVPEPWVGYRIDSFINNVVCKSFAYECINDVHLLPDWREPGVASWVWAEYDHDKAFVELAISLKTSINVAILSQPVVEEG